MTYVIIFQPPGLPAGEYKYTCEGDEKLVRYTRALKMLGVELIDIERDGESLTVQEFAELVGD